MGRDDKFIDLGYKFWSENLKLREYLEDLWGERIILKRNLNVWGEERAVRIQLSQERDHLQVLVWTAFNRHLQRQGISSAAEQLLPSQTNILLNGVNQFIV
jgi:hypothetical protein